MLKLSIESLRWQQFSFYYIAMYTTLFLYTNISNTSKHFDFVSLQTNYDNHKQTSLDKQDIMFIITC